MMTKLFWCSMGLVSLVGCSAYPAYMPCQKRVATAECYVSNTMEITPLTQNTFVATDALLQHSSKPLPMGQRLWVTSVADLSDLENSNALGRLLGEQIATRLVQLGYDVRETRLHKDLVLIPHTGEFSLARDHALHYAQEHAENVVTGTYSVAHNQVFITLKILSLADARAFASHAYSLPIDANIAALLKPKRHWWW